MRHGRATGMIQNVWDLHMLFDRLSPFRARRKAHSCFCSYSFKPLFLNPQPFTRPLAQVRPQRIRILTILHFGFPKDASCAFLVSSSCRVYRALGLDRCGRGLYKQCVQEASSMHTCVAQALFTLPSFSTTCLLCILLERQIY